MSGAIHWLRTTRGHFRRAASLPLSDRGFRYGMAIFETIGIRQGKALFLDEHLQSGLEACKSSSFYVDQTWFQQAGEFLRRNLQPGDTGVARIHVTAGDGSPAEPADRCRMLLSYEPRSAIPPSLYEAGYRLSICATPFLPAFDGRKTHNYWQNVNALQTARSAGADECLVFNPAGQLASACMANVFVVFGDGQIATPGIVSGCRSGVVRQWVMHNRNVREMLIVRRDLQHVREIFLTSSWLGIMPVAKMNNARFVKRPVSINLMSMYHC